MEVSAGNSSSILSSFSSSPTQWPAGWSLLILDFFPFPWPERLFTCSWLPLGPYWMQREHLEEVYLVLGDSSFISKVDNYFHYVVLSLNIFCHFPISTATTSDLNRLSLGLFLIITHSPVNLLYLFPWNIPHFSFLDFKRSYLLVKPVKIIPISSAWHSKLCRLFLSFLSSLFFSPLLMVSVLWQFIGKLR